jgi:hypothetical protein
MQKRFPIIIFSFLILFSLTLSAYADDCLASKKEAFRRSFLATNLDSSLLIDELSKYQTQPLLYLQYFKFLESTLTEPLIHLKYESSTDSLGRLVILPKILVKELSAEDYPNAAYLKGLLEYNKDFASFSDARNSRLPTLDLTSDTSSMSIIRLEDH